MNKREEKNEAETDRFYAAKWNPFRSETGPVTSDDYIHHTKNLVWFWCGVASAIVGIVLIVVSFCGIPRVSEAFVGLFAIGFTAALFGVLASSFSAFLQFREKRYRKTHEATDTPL